MISAEAVRRYCDNVYASCPVYLWGADGEVLTKELYDKLVQRFGASNYTNILFDRDEGKFGYDCSGLLRNISGFDTTAAGYYSKCPIKGKASDMPLSKVCLLFREEKGNITHVAVYMGNGTITEMRNGCEQKVFKPSSWTYYGIPDWIEQDKEPKPIYPQVPFLITALDKVPYYADRSICAPINGYLSKGIKYTIVEVKNDFGRLKSGVGYVCLNKSNISY